MKTSPDIEAVIDRRLLLNFRVDPETAARLVPAPFRPSLSTGFAIAGVCLIRLTELRPHGFPRAIGITTESAAHRFAVEWDTRARHRARCLHPASRYRLASERSPRRTPVPGRPSALLAPGA